ncbi:hypothetical protein niasHT_013923 [Heterodera trifolii]|uniref:G-protein coupled receptors family 1 profile domain-containing protein n=1 Tax=Heterodera trifolii TaxID=157864 RepID=A0ABD2L1X6_9BILA
MNATSDPLYEKYANKGLIPEEILATGIIAVICLMAICLNFSLVFVTIKTKSLHSPCKTLIALFAFFASFLLFGNCIKFFVFLFGFNYIPLKSCFLIQIVPLICSSLAINLQCGIGIDRLFGVVFPIWYKSRGKHISFKAIITFCCIRSAINGFIIYINMFIIQFILPLLNFDAFAIEFFVHPISVFCRHWHTVAVHRSEYRSAFRSLFTHQTAVVKFFNNRQQQNNNNNNNR